MTTTTKITKKAAGAYIEAVGRRKTAIARVRITPASKTEISVNGKDFTVYFGTDVLRHSVLSPLTREGATEHFSVSARVSGGGVRAQAEAIRHALSRAIVKTDETKKGEFKKLGFLKRDARKKERKHFGLKKARKASQWSKR
jgi:small subunit ribosomal protein S9